MTIFSQSVEYRRIADAGMKQEEKEQFTVFADVFNFHFMENEIWEASSEAVHQGIRTKLSLWLLLVSSSGTKMGFKTIPFWWSTKLQGRLL